MSNRSRRARETRPVTVAARPRRRPKLVGVLAALAVIAAIAFTVLSKRSSSPTGTSRGSAVDVPDPDTSGMELPVVEIIAESRARVLQNPNSGEAWGSFAAALDAHDLFRHAEVAYRRALELAPDDLKCAYNLAIVLQSLGADQEAVLDLFRRFAEREPGFPPVHVRIGIVLAEKGDLQGAARAYRRALELDPQLTIARRSLGQVRLAMDDAAGAVEDLERTAKSAPQDGPTQAALSQAYARLGNEAKGLEAAARARGRGETLSLPDPARFLVTQQGRSEKLAMSRAQGRMKEGDFAGAIEDLKIVLRTRPSSPGVHEQLADAYERAGRKAQAEAHRAEAKKLRLPR
jgi:predicted Zn-dependent protease